MPRISRTTLLLFLLVALPNLLLLAPSAGAAGEYGVRLTGTSGSHWSTFGGLPFITSDGRVYSGSAQFATGDYKAWRMNAGGQGATRIIGGTIVAAIDTPDAVMQGRLMVGTGSVNTVLYDGGASGTIRRDIPAGPFDWFQFDLRSTGSVRTSGVGTNHLDLTYVDLQLRDSVSPTIVPTQLPPATVWHGAGTCIGFSIRTTDQGSGVSRIIVTNAANGAVVTDVVTPRIESPRPAPPEQVVSDCVQPHERGHGDTTILVRAWDIGGNSREYTFSVRADRLAPGISGGPADGGQLTTSTPRISFEVGDQGSGVAAVSAAVDGRAVAANLHGTTLTLDVPPLAPGAHTISVSASDAAGNPATATRRVVVADVTPPTLVLTSPGVRGASSATVAIRASDDMTGIDPATWTLLIDGDVTAFEGDAERLTASLRDLEPGAHRIDVSVRDRAGDRAVATHSYYVVSTAVTPTSVEAKAPGRTGITLVDGPRAPVGYGGRASVTVHVARDGGPVASQLVEVRHGSVVAGSAMTDEDGVARVRVAVRKPGPYHAMAVGMGVDPADVGIRVAPRLVVATSTSRPTIGSRVVVTGRMYPALRGRRVSIEAQVGGVWYPVGRSAAVNAQGRFRSYIVAMSRSRVAVRVRIKATAPWAGASSNAVTLNPR